MERFTDWKKVFDIDFEKVVSDIMKMPETKKVLIDYNQKDQLSEGIDSLGQKIETISANEQNLDEVYSTFTIKERLSNGLQIENVDLKDTGAFWNSFDVKVSNDESEITANFSKGSDDIRDNFDKKYDFLGLTENSKENFVWDYFSEIFTKTLKSLVKR